MTHPYKMNDAEKERRAERLNEHPHPSKKLINIDGKFYRVRRGKMVEVPPEWVGQFPTSRTKRKRQPIKRRTRKSKKERS